MKLKPRSSQKRKHPKAHLRLPDLEYSRTAVLNSLTSADGQRGYGHAIDEFVDWYCSAANDHIGIESIGLVIDEA